MGAGISDWRLARAVSAHGQLGVVSGTALDTILARRLQEGDPGGHVRWALDRFPDRAMVDRIRQRYYVEGGKSHTRAFKPLPMAEKDGPRELIELRIVANFVEVLLARAGHDGDVGINYLEKIQIPHLPSIYGAMLAGVGYILMGAGIPVKIPGVLDRFVNHDQATYPLTVIGADDSDDTTLTFDPRMWLDFGLAPLRRPTFLPIVSSVVLAATLLKRSNGAVNGFVVEGPTAGGHNAPPRGKLQLNEAGEPVYGERDVVDLEKLRALGLPFWLAGGYGTAEGLVAAHAAGAAGVQVGTAFAFCDESGLRTDYKHALLEDVRMGRAKVVTDPVASPTSFPFKVVQCADTVSDPEVYEARTRVCDLGYLREAYRAADGQIGFRCAAEPIDAYVKKDGRIEDTKGRKCVCNALIANIGMGQVRGRGFEAGLVTSGDDLARLTRFLSANSVRYSAADVIDHILRRG